MVVGVLNIYRNDVHHTIFSRMERFFTLLNPRDCLGYLRSNINKTTKMKLAWSVHSSFVLGDVCQTVCGAWSVGFIKSDFIKQFVKMLLTFLAQSVGRVPQRCWLSLCLLFNWQSFINVGWLALKSMCLEGTEVPRVGRLVITSYNLKYQDLDSTLPLIL